MHPRIEEALTYLDSERVDLRDAIAVVPPNLRDQSPAPDRWSVAQVLQHLALIENRVGALISKRISGARAEGLGPEIESSPILNERHAAKIADRSFKVSAPPEIAPPSDIDAETAWAALEQSRETLRAAVISGDGLALSEIIHPHPVLGEINLYQWILFVGSHEVRHIGQVREIAEQLNGNASTAGSD